MVDRTAARSHRKVAALVRSRTRTEWLDLLAREDIPAEMVLSAAEARAQRSMYSSRCLWSYSTTGSVSIFDL